MGLKDLMGGVQGMLGNYSEMTVEDANKEAKEFLMENEKIKKGFKLLRDMLIFTDKRILLFDKQGMTGAKIRVVSINYASIVSVSVETAGAGFDDSEINLVYATTPYLKGHTVSYETKKFEFPKKFDVASLYRYLQEFAYENYIKING